MNQTSEGSLLQQFKQWLKSMPLIAIPIMFCRILRGYATYRHILQACPPEDGWRVWFMDYDGSGDTYLTCGYLQARGLLGMGDAFAASGDLTLKIAKLFHFGRYTSIAPKAALTVRIMERFLGQKLKLLPLLYESIYLEYSGIFRRMEGHRGMDFMTMLKIGLEANCGVSYEEKPWQQPELSYDPAEVDKIFRIHGLIPGRTVLLSPYAGKHNMWGIPMEFYSKLATQLQTAGYTVCTNSGNKKKEPPVPGTVPLLVPHRLIRAFCERAGGFVGLRSGLCDIVAAAEGCRKIILYIDIPISSVAAIHQDVFSLNKIGLCTDAVELKVTEQGYASMFSRIMTHFI